MPRARLRGAGFPLLVGLAASCGCESYPFLPFAETRARSTGRTTQTTSSRAFTPNLILARTFTDGTTVTTATYATADLNRTPLVIDFDHDGRADAAVGYGGTTGVAQILLGRGDGDSTRFQSLTFDARLDWEGLTDVAVGDIDGDGWLDLIIATPRGVAYLRQPNASDRGTLGRSTTDLRYWGAGNPDAAREILSGTDETLTGDDLMAIVNQAVGPLVNLDDYVITVTQGYTNVEIGDMDNDGDNDVVAARRLIIDLTPRPGFDQLPPIQIVNGAVQVLLNPGSAIDGSGWTATSVGAHERLTTGIDRYEPTGLMLVDMDGDGDLDALSTDLIDNNVQVAWFQNPQIDTCPDPLRREGELWTQWRVGSIRDAFGVDVADLTGDGWPDVVASGSSQQQVILFEHPGVPFCDTALSPQRPNARFEYDWDAYVIIDFQSFRPRDVKALDLDGDGQLDLVVGGSGGAVRYFKAPINPRSSWTANVVANFQTSEGEGEGDVGRLGYGDFDSDGDLDLIAVVNAEQDLDERLIWIRNDLP
jgi:hypothetical protein